MAARRRRRGKMEPRPLTRSLLSPILFYTILAWTAFCLIGTWFIILKCGLIFKGFIAAVMTLFFGTVIWAIPFSGLVLFYLYIGPRSEPSP
jgi:uncharacterized RDD family membrane protein YckC